MTFQSSPSLWASVKATIVEQGRVQEIAERYGFRVTTDKRPFFCPVCGKVKAWMRADGSGGCNVCNKTFPNVVDFVAMATNRNADEVRREIAAYLGIASKGGSVAKALPPASPKVSALPTPKLSPPKSKLWNLLPIPKRIGATYCSETAYTQRALDSVGAKYGRWQPIPKGKSPAHDVIAVPIYQSDLLEPVNFQLRTSTRKPFVLPDGTFGELTKRVAFEGQGKTGIIISDRHRQMLLDGVPIEGLKIIKTEGESDLLSLIERMPTDQPFIAFTNSDGAKSVHAWAIDMIERLEPCEYIIVHDRDKAGEDGSIRWAKEIAKRSKAIIKNVILPFEFQDKKGADLQDFFKGGATWEGFEMMIINTPSCRAMAGFDDEVEEDVRSVERIDAPEAIREGADAPSPDATIPDNIQAIYDAYSYAPSIPNSALRRSSARNHFLIDGFLVRHQPAIFAGASKTLKTTECIDLSISLASGKPFLGKFNVPTPQRVLFLSAESGEPTLRDTESAIAESRGVLDAIDGDMIHWGFWVPFIPDDEQLKLLDFELKRTKADVVILDPCYMMLDGSAQAFVSLNAQQLAKLNRVALANGATAIFVDHAKRSSVNTREFAPLELDDITGAGKAEFCRQWFLMSRRRKFDPDQPHDLWMTYGGSAGHAGLLGITVDMPFNADGARTYSVEVEAGHETRERMAQASADRKEQKKTEATRERLRSHSRQVWEAFTGETAPMTKNQIRNKTGLNADNANRAISFLIQNGFIEATSKPGAKGQSWDAFSRTSKAVDEEF